MKFGRIFLHVNICVDWLSRISYMTSYFQDGGRDVRPPLAAAYAADSAGCRLAHRARVYSCFSDNAGVSLGGGVK